jgi:hypothetical protein
MPVPPEGAREEARRGLEWRQEYNRGGTMVGVARARDLANGADISPDTIRRMVSFFARHEVDKQGRGYNPGEPGYPSAGRIAWALWGGDPGRTWAEAQAKRLEKKMTEQDNRRPARLKKLRITRVDRVSSGANPDAHVLLFKRFDSENVANHDSDVVYSGSSDASGDDRQMKQENNMTVDRETLAPEVAALLTEIEAERDAAVAKAAELEQAQIASGDEDEDTEDAVLKSLDPTVRERIEKAETERAELAERIAKMEDDALTSQFIAKAADYKSVDADVDGVGSLLKDVAKHCAPESAQTLERVLKAASARLDEAHRLITAEIGTAAGLDTTDAGRKIEALAKARSEQTGEAMPVATAAILNDNPDLYEQARAQRV